MGTNFEEDGRVGLDERMVRVLQRRSQDDMALVPSIPELAIDTSEQSDQEVGGVGSRAISR